MLHAKVHLGGGEFISIWPVFTSRRQVVVMVAVFCFCWGPYASFAMINITGHGKVGDQNSCRDLQVWPSITRTFPWYWPSCLFNFVKLSSSGTRSSLSSWTPWYNFPFFNSIESLHCMIWMIPQTLYIYKLTLPMMQFSNFSNQAPESFHEYHL